MEAIEVIVELPNYDLSFTADNYRRYYIYKDEKQGDQKNQFATCRKCGKDVDRPNGGTSGLKKHSKICDNEAWKLLDERKSRSTSLSPSRKCLNPITQFFEPVKKWDNDSVSSKQMDRNLLKFICTNRLPLNFVEYQGLQELLPEKYELKGRTFITGLLEKQYELEFGKMIDRLQSVESFALTADGWSSKNNAKSFISLTVHYIDNEFKRHFEVVSCLPTVGSKDGNSIAADIIEALSNAKIPLSKCHLLVRDAAPAMIKGANLANLTSIDCMIHKLQLSVKDALKDYKLIIKQAKKLPALFNRSSKFRSDFEKTTRALGFGKKNLIQNVPTRWDTVYSMIERLLEFRTVLNAMVEKVYETRDEAGNKEKYKIPSLNFECLEFLIEGLKPVAVLTKKLSLRDASVADILPIYYGFLKEWQVNESTKKDEIWQLGQKITIGLDKRMKDMKFNKNLIIATTLDPRYKFKVFSTYDRTVAFNLVVEELQKIQSSKSENSNSPPSKRIKANDDLDLMNKFLDGDEEIIENSDSKAFKKELINYLNEARIPYKSGPSAVLDYWRVSNYGFLKKLAQRFLCAPPTSVESERLFSQLKMIYTDKRGNLSGEHAEQQLFLRYAWSELK